MNIHTALVVAAIICFAFGAFRVGIAVDLMLLGFAFLSATLIV